MLARYKLLAIILVIIKRVLNEIKVDFVATGSLFAFAISLMPYTGIPNAANKAKYCAYENINCASPIPFGPNILAAYGKLTSGNRILDKESNIL